MKLKQVKRKNGSIRYLSVPEGVSKTDQSDKDMVNINSIMSRYRKTGLLPQFKEKVAQYIDTTQIPSYMDAHEQISRANEMFMQLPSDVRKLMDNNPANLEKVLQDEKYHDLLVDYGILKKQVKNVEQSDVQANVKKEADQAE